MRIRQSVCLPPLLGDDLPLETLCREAARIGVAAVEIWHRGDDFEHIVATARQNNLAIASMCGHQSTRDGLNQRANHDRIEAELSASIDLAAKYAIPGLICFSGNRVEGQDDAEAIAITAEGLRRCAPYAERKGINLNMELLNSLVNHPGYQCDRTAWGVAVCRKVNSPRVKLLYDIYHMQIMEGNIIQTIRDNIQWIGHFHTAGVPGRHDLDDQQELNYPAICRAIAASGYAGYVGQEFWPRGDKLAALRQAFIACDQR